MPPVTGQRVKPEEFAHEKALADAIVTALGKFFIARTDDLPHRFRAPASFGEYMRTNWGANSTYHSIPIHGMDASHYMSMEMTNRPNQKIFEIVFQAADGMRLFTLEIEYSAIQEEGQ